MENKTRSQGRSPGRARLNLVRTIVFGGLISVSLPAQIKFSGTFAYEYVGTTVAFGVTRIDNFRPIGTVSGTLAIQLWATSAPYTGLSTLLVGNKIAEVQIGTLLGGYYVSPVARTAVMTNLPAPGYYNIVFVLAEWNGFQWLSVDYGNFPTYQAIGLVVAPPAISRQPQSLSLTVGGGGTLSVTVTGTSPMSFQWYRNGVAIAGKTDSTLVFTNAQTSDSATFSVRVSNSAGSVTSNSATVTVNPATTAPVISIQPQPLALSIGGTGTLSVGSSGSAPLSFQWFKDGTQIDGKTAATLSIVNAATGDAGTYTVRVTNTAGIAFSNAATVTVTQAASAPAISAQPQPLNLAAGASGTLTVGTAGATPLSFQWFRNGVLLSGKTESSLGISNAQSADAGSYAVRISNSVGSVMSNVVTVSVTEPASALVIVTHPSDQTVLEGTTATLRVSATSGAPLEYAWTRNGNPIYGATSSSLTISPVSRSDEGVYAARITSGATTVTSSQAALSVLPASALSNLSVRTSLGSGQTLTLGAVISGGQKDVLIRAAGPVLGKFGLSGMGDPRLDLYRGGTAPSASNDDWSSSLSATFASVGAFAFEVGSKDAAIRESLSGAFTVQARGTGPGVILVETYDITGGTGRRLVNVSARNHVGTGDDILIAGFAISGTGTKRVLIRAVGPTLSAFGVEGALADPVVRVFDGRGNIVGSNDNWDSSLSVTFSQVGAFPLTGGSRDSAIVVSLPAGASYTVQVSGSDGGTGEALVEVYEIP